MSSEEAADVVGSTVLGTYVVGAFPEFDDVGPEQAKLFNLLVDLG
ncbi:hypothetical protein BKA10_002437 [Microbacterium invictum]|uniref:Uncharacterized protein n=1 Tax=Microbacterium invictum TaxID=515415 RepID=A0AA40VNP3_9MICO|nr:hypothetical protein [Microbacterium invictum]MBB4140643.1 hypothetical protein [Microbacterium invictum]